MLSNTSRENGILKLLFFVLKTANCKRVVRRTYAMRAALMSYYNSYPGPWATHNVCGPIISFGYILAEFKDHNLFIVFIVNECECFLFFMFHLYLFIYLILLFLFIYF